MGQGQQEGVRQGTRPEVSLTAVLASLPKFTPAQRAQVQAALLTLRSKEDGPQGPHEAVAQAVAAVLAENGIRVQPLHVFKRRQEYASFRTGAELVHEFVARWLKPKSRGEEQKALRMMIENLIQRMKSQRKEITQGTVALNIHRAPGIMDLAFPGYRESGKLPWVIR